MKNNISAVAPSFVKACALGVALSVSAFAQAAPTTYSTPGTENLITYSFTAAETGDLVAYFISRGEADYTNTLSVFVNGVDTGFSGLGNQTSAYGDSLNFGSVNAGDSVVFAISVADTGKTWYSDKSQNNDGNVNHIFSAAYEGDDFIPVGTYVAFEDLTADNDPQIDYDYIDLQFVVTNVTTETVGTPEVPVPAAAWLFASGLLGLAGISRRRSHAI